MLRPQREKPNANFFTKFVRIFGLLMTTLYIVLGVFIMFVDEQTMRLNMSSEFRYVLGGVLILYGIIRFIKVYQANTKKDRRYEE